jgi:nuclear pore complex protein Nup155
VSTLDEVMLCALILRDGKLGIVPTRYTLPCDDIPIVSVCGISDGRIFLGGYDGSLYEFEYENLVSKGPHLPKTNEQRLKDYYDGTATSIPLKDFSNAYQVLRNGKRALDSLLGGSERPLKCRKLNHSAKGFSAVAGMIVPDWLRKAPAALFGAENPGPLEKILHDAERHCLYTLTARGFISVYDMRGKGLTINASIDCDGLARQYLSAVAKGHMFPPSSSIEFVGGGVAAQAGAGGMDGARSILKLATDVKTRVLIPVSIHVLPRSDSSRLTLLAVTAGGLRYYLTSLSPSVNKSNLAPTNKIIMCHIRAPPPIDPSTGCLNESMEERDVPGGMVPCLLPRVSVDSTSYADGHLFLALQKPQLSMGSSDAEVGNIILGTNADFVLRKVTNKDDKVVREAPGGVTETVSLPATLLPGGRIMDSSAIGYSRGSPLMRLILYSQTPSDSELNVGLVPPFFPRVVSNLNDGKKSDEATSTSSLEVARSTALGKVSVSRPPRSGIALQVFSNFLLSRPLGYGITFHAALDRSTSASQVHQYRISNRYGCGGFSSTAGENGKKDVLAGVSGNHKSARLSSWLLCPSLVPLDEIAINHVLPPMRTIAVSVAGMHYFKRNTVLTCLAETLMRAGPNVARDTHVIEFFNNYGPKQFCTLAFMLAIGCGPSMGTDKLSESIRSRAYKAAFGNGGEPRLTRKPVIGDARDSFVVQDSTSDPLVPNGYEFTPSYLSEAVFLVTSRLLRPVWYKPAVVVTEGQTMKMAGSSPKEFPAKVEMLLDDATLKAVRSPLFTLMQLMQQLFRRAVEEVPGVGSTNSNQMDIDESSVLIGSMRYQGALRLHGNGTDVMSMDEATATARLIEERNLHSLYRLISRSVQFLDLLSLLKRSQFMPDLPEVKWGLLHGLTMSQLVENRDGQERVETLLNSLVSNTKVVEGANVTPTADSERLAQSLTDQCFLYFSPGAGFSFLGFRAAYEAMNCSQMSPRRALLSHQAVEHFKKAARFWTNAQLITGRFLHSGEAESYEQKMNLAIQYDSPLARAASLLLKIGEYVAMIDICIITADNFSGSTSASIAVGDQSSAFQWEKRLYHYLKTDDRSPNETGTSSATNAIVVSSSVTAQDAISTCYAIILCHFLTVRNSSVDGVATKTMVSACAASPDKDFRNAFFEFLLNTKNESLLVKIDSPEVETWLNGKKDPHMMWQYYIAHQKHSKAGDFMWNLATDANQTFSLDDRILFLERSQSSYDSGDIDNRIRAAEHLDVARLQLITLKAIESLGLGVELDKGKLQLLKSRLLDVSTLYNSYAAELELHDVCLRILRSCRHDEAERIEVLWQKIICQEVLPCSTRSMASYNFLCRLAGNDSRAVKLLSADAQDNANSAFEDGLWVERVKQVVIALGSELYGKGFEFIFPAEFVVKTLEGTLSFQSWLALPHTVHQLSFSQQDCGMLSRHLPPRHGLCRSYCPSESHFQTYLIHMTLSLMEE